MITLLGTFITLPVDFMTTITGYTSDLFNDLKPLILLVIGLLVGFFIIQRILDALFHRKVDLIDEEED